MAVSNQSDDTYHSNIVSGDHGSQFQKNLFLIIFERLTMEKRVFKLAYEMTDAGKFDDVVVFLKSAEKDHEEGCFFQAKHTDTSKGRPGSLTYDMLFPTDFEKSSGDFNLYKYIVSYFSVRKKFQAKKKVFIFTNRDLAKQNIVNSSSGFINIVGRKVDKILDFSGQSVGLDVNDEMVKKVQATINQEFNKLKDAISSLFKSGVVEPIIEKYITPLNDVLKKSKGTVKFQPSFSAESSKAELCQLYAALKEENENFQKSYRIIDCKNSSDHQIENVFLKKSNIRKLPQFVDENTVREFFDNFILSVKQPDDLSYIIRDDLQVWMKTWMRPEYFGKLDKAHLEIPFREFKSIFDKLTVNKTFKQYLSESNGNQILLKIKGLKVLKQKQFCPSYINRKIFIVDRKRQPEENVIDYSDELTDDEFARELTGQLNDHRCFILSAEPGMGKTTVFQYIAHQAQQLPNRLVFMIYLNKIQRALKNIESVCDMESALLAFNGVISEVHCEIIRNVLNGNCKQRIIMFFDAIDEMDGEDRNKMLMVFKQLLTVPKLQIVVGGRRHVEGLLEKELKEVTCSTMSLASFNENDQVSFLRVFWNCTEHNELIFYEYAIELLKLFNATENRTLYEFTGLPLTLKMLAEIKQDAFEVYSRAEDNSKSTSATHEIVRIVDLYEQFIERSFSVEMMKLFPNLKQKSKKYNIFFDSFIIGHQLLAIEKLKLPFWNKVIKIKEFKEEYDDFMGSINDHDGKSPLVEFVNKIVQFVHLSYAEFFAAKFIYLYMDKIMCPEFENTFCSKDFKVIQGFLFAIVETKNDFKCFKILLKGDNDTVKHELANKVLIDATKFFKVFKFLIDTYDSDLNVNFSGSSGETALSIAAEHGYFQTVQLLIEKNANINSVDSCGKTPLHLAVQNNHIDVMKLLLEQSATVNATDKDGWAPLHTAVKFGNVDSIKLLLKYNANLKITNNLGQFPASISILRIKKCKSTIKYYSKKECTSSSLRLSRYNTHYGEKFKEYSHKLNVLNAMLKLMIESLDDPNATNKLGETLLHHAARKGDEETVCLLLKYSANIDARDKEQQTPLLLAARYNHIDVLKMLLEQSANVNLADKNGWTPLHKAVKQDSTHAVELLLSRKANLKMADKSGQTPVHHAISQLREIPNETNLRMLKLMIDKLDDVNSINEQGRSLLHHAVKENVKEAVDILLLRSVHVDALDKDKQTPLHLAARYNYNEILTLLLAKSAPLNAADKDGLTPLHIAVRYVSVEAVELLLRHGANLQITKNLGETPVHIVITRLRKCKLNIEYYIRKLDVSSGTTPPITDDQTKYYKKEMEKLCSQQAIFKNLLKMMIDKLDDVNVVFKKEDTLLHHAAKEGIQDAVSLLLNRSANANAQDMDKRTPLCLATLNKRFDVLKLLLDKSANVNAADKDGMTPLHIAAREGFDQAFELFLNYKANLNAQNVLGQTPAHIAIESIKACSMKIKECKKESGAALEKIINKLNSCVKMLKLILENLDDANAVSAIRQSLFHFVTDEDVEEAVSLLLNELYLYKCSKLQ